MPQLICSCHVILPCTFLVKKKGRKLGKGESAIRSFVWIIEVVIFWIVHEHNM